MAAGDGLAAQFSAAQEAVNRVMEEQRELEAFRGKEIFKIFYEKHVTSVIPGNKASGYHTRLRGRRLAAKPDRALSSSAGDRATPEH